MSLSVGQNGNKATQAQSVKPQKSGGIQRSDSIDHLPKELVGTGEQVVTPGVSASASGLAAEEGVTPKQVTELQDGLVAANSTKSTHSDH